MRRRLRPERARAFGIGLTIVLLSACGPHAQEGISMDQLQSDIIFGVPSPSPLNTAPPIEQAVAPSDLVPLSLPAFNFPEFPEPSAAPTPSGPCPIAGLTAFPAAPAGTNVQNPPQAGSYNWKQEGYVTVKGQAYSLSGLVQRLIKNVSTPTTTNNPQNGQPNTTFTYETVQPYASTGNNFVLTWQIMTNAPNVNESSPITPPSPAPGAVQQSHPEGGLALKEIQYLDHAGKQLAAPFKPAVGVLYFPLPVTPGQQWDSKSTDPQSQMQVELQGTVGNRQRIDACGDVVDGWAATSTITYTGVESTQTPPAQQMLQQSYNFIFAPQLGGIITQETISGDSTLGKINASYTFGQLHPGPLPAGQ